MTAARRGGVWTWVGRIALAATLALALGAAGCVNMMLPRANMRAEAPAAVPALLGAFGEDPAIISPADWAERRAPLLRAAFESHVYGAYPAPASAEVLARTAIAVAGLAPSALVEQWTIAAGDRRFNMIVATDGADPRPRPALIMQNFCGNRAATPGRSEAIADTLSPIPEFCSSPLAGAAAQAIMGRHINTPPIAKIVAQGYALAYFYAGDVIADSVDPALAALPEMAKGAQARTGALAAWAWAYSRALDVLAEDPRIDPARIAIWGHSRNGKAALLAAAFDPRIAAVIAHQSGKGGATLTRSYGGESVAQITNAYPHWFAPAYAAYADREGEAPVDQHQLLALIAPRPVLLGNARRDAWSDPLGAFAAARAAAPAYALYGVDAESRLRLDRPDMTAPLAFYLRGGIHGVTSQDWRMFLAFMDAHLKAPPAAIPSQETIAAP